MTVEKMREWLLQAYSGDKWKSRVWGMRDEQIIAVYKSMKTRDPAKRKSKKMEPDIQKAQQLSIWDSGVFAG